MLIKSSPNVEEVGRCLRTEEGELSKDSKPQGLSEDHQTNTMVFRSNPLPDLKLLLTNRTDRRVTQSDDEVEIQVFCINPSKRNCGSRQNVIRFARGVSFKTI